MTERIKDLDVPKFEFHENFIAYINKSGLTSISLIKPMEIPKYKSSPPKGNMENVPIKVIKNIIKEPYLSTWSNEKGEVVKVMEIDEDKAYGIFEDDFSLIKNLVERIYKLDNVQLYISLDFVSSQVLNWIFHSYRNPSAYLPLADSILNSFNEAVKEYNVYIPIMYLDIELQLIVGYAHIKYFSKQQLDYLESEFNKAKKNKDASFKYIKEDLNGKVFAQITIVAESKRAKEYAYEECSLAIACLRICSPVSSFPYIKSDFDLDRKSSVLLKNDIILQNPSEPHFFIFSKSRNAEIYEINQKEYDYLMSKHLNLFHQFLTKADRNTELVKIINHSIRSFSEALKDNIIQSRISKLFSIYESLILQNENESILESLRKYLPKLICEKREQRLEVIEVITKMYAIRSAYVHHAKMNDVDLILMKRLQINLALLIVVFIQLTTRFKNKSDVFKHINDKIMDAFKMSELFMSFRS